MAKKGKKVLEKRGVRDEEEIDNEEIAGNEGVDDSDVPKSEKVMEKQQDEEVLEKDEDDIYDKGEREEQMEEDEISTGEAGFVEGYEDTEEGVCSTCGKGIDPEAVVEKEVNGQVFTFCSKKCADLFDKRKAGLR